MAIKKASFGKRKSTGVYSTHGRAVTAEPPQPIQQAG